VRPTARIAHKSLADGLLIAACSAYICWCWLIERAQWTFDGFALGFAAKLAVLLGAALAMWTVVCLTLAIGRRRRPGRSTTLLAWGPVTAAIVSCLAHLAVYHRADNTSIVIATVIGAALGWRQTLMLRDLRAYAAELAGREAMFRRLAHTDALTGLGNRRALEYVLARQTHPQSKSVLLFIDLDGFKAINDARGHDVGDVILREFAERVRANLRAGDFAARYGGDEFVLVLRPSPDDAVAAASRLLAVFCAPYYVGDTPLVLSASIGFARCDAFDDVDALIRCADLALRRAKSNGKCRIESYDGHLEPYDGHLDSNGRHEVAVQRRDRTAVTAC
jgi:diguanylate cyclase (GGDEF)-like protein